MKHVVSLFGMKIALLFACILPIAAMAQIDHEYYGRPSYWRPYDQRGINVFETKKTPDSIPFEGLRIRFGAGFTIQFQDLKHENAKNSGATRLYPLQRGFMTSQANLFTDVQLADGISMNVTTYLSARHHNEAWVKGGYIQFDKLPFLKSKLLDKFMEIATFKVGHMEINYGDAHFRRSDGGHTLYNPFMESYIMDAFATEIGGEVYLKKNGFFGMLGITNGLIKGNVDSTYKSVAPDGGVIDDNIKRSPSIYLKGGIDESLGDKLRVRVTGSYYHNGSAMASGQNLYGGDRTGSNYQNVMENVPSGAALPASTAVAFSGRVNPAFTKKIDAIMLNGFLKVGGVELFGTYETAKGRTKTEIADRKANQIAGDIIYRFGNAENFYLGARYNEAKITLAKTAITTGNFDVKVNRLAFAGGWFMTRNVLVKAEYVEQKYMDFPVGDYREHGKFYGYVIEAVVGF
jgi:hypothetical protein